MPNVRSLLPCTVELAEHNALALSYATSDGGVIADQILRSVLHNQSSVAGLLQVPLHTIDSALPHNWPPQSQRRASSGCTVAVHQRC